MNALGINWSSPNDICQNCLCARWKHKMVQYFRKYKAPKIIGHCTRCGSLKCKYFRRVKI